MLQARSIAIVGASARPDSFGARMIAEVSSSPGRIVHLVNPRYDSVAGRACVPTLGDIDGPVDLALLGVGDGALQDQLQAAADHGVRSAVIFGGAHGFELRASLRSIALGAGMAVCGAGCMGFVNVADGLRATGYVERAQLPVGPIALVTHSGSVFSALLRTRRALGYTLAVSSGQELVTTTADYLEFVLDHTEARVVALVLETVRDGPRLVTALRRAAERGIAVVVLPVGGSPLGSSMVAAHSGALAGARAMWDALAEGTGTLLVGDLAELTDTLELLAVGRRAAHGAGIATVHDSGAERTLVADLAHELSVPFAPLGQETLSRLDGLLDDGLIATNPLDLWGTGADTRALFGSALQAMADDPGVSAVALAVDLVEEYDGDTAYPDAALDVETTVPLVVLTNLASAVDGAAAARLRAAGVPVLEGTRSGLVALRHLLTLARRTAGADAVAVIDPARRERWLGRLAAGGPLDGVESFALLADYGIAAARVRAVDSERAAIEAAHELGWPVVLKTDDPAIAHKTEVGGVVVGLGDPDALRTAYADLRHRLGPRALVCESVLAGVEVAVGMTHDPQLGALVVAGAGGVFAELISDRAVALPPLTAARAENMLLALRINRLIDGWRGAPPADRSALVGVVVAVAQLATELGSGLAALDLNPVFAGPFGAVAVDALVVPRQAAL